MDETVTLNGLYSGDDGNSYRLTNTPAEQLGPERWRVVVNIPCMRMNGPDEIRSWPVIVKPYPA